MKELLVWEYEKKKEKKGEKSNYILEIDIERRGGSRWVRMNEEEIWEGQWKKKLKMKEDLMWNKSEWIERKREEQKKRKDR